MSSPTWPSIVFALVAIAPVTLSSSCVEIECGEGTREVDGACVPADEAVGPASCGEGTVLGPDGKCESVNDSICGDNAERRFNEETGLWECVGTGGDGCGSPRQCPAPVAGRISVCGRLRNVEDNTPIGDQESPPVDCAEDGAPTDRACALQMRFYDALAFAGNPSTPPLTVNTLSIDSCGRFVANDVPVPSLGFVGIGVDDAVGAPDLYRLTGVAFGTVSPGSVYNNQTTYVLEVATDEAWSEAVLPPGDTFAELGAVMMLFKTGTTPSPDVQIEVAGSIPPAANTFFFDDASATTRSMITAADGDERTRLNGAGIVIGSPLAEHTGTGGETNGCMWGANQARSIPGVMFVTERLCQ